MMAQQHKAMDALRAFAVIMVSLVCLSLGSDAALAQNAAPPGNSDEQAPGSNAQAVSEKFDETHVAPVEIDGETLFLVRGSTALPAQERADEIEKRIIELAENSFFKDFDVTTLDNEFGRAVLVNGRMITIATQADADMEGLERDLLGTMQAEAIKNAILAYREDRTDEARVDSAIAAAGWTAGFLLLTVIFLRFRKRIARKAAEFTNNYVSQVEAATKSVVRSEPVMALVVYLLNATLWVLYLIALYYFVTLILNTIAETRGIAQFLLNYVSAPLQSLLRGIIGIIPNLITLAVIAIVARFLVRGLRIFFDNVEAGTITLRNFERHWIKPTFQIARVILIVIALVFAYPFIPGSDTTAFQGLTILAGIMVSLGSNSVMSNIMAGLFVLYRRSTNVGDRIKVGEVVGDVIEVRIMETLINSIKNEMISIPNSQLLASEVTNYSRKIDGRGLILHTTVSIGYEEPPEKIIAMLIEAAKRTPGLKSSPEPFVLWKALGDFAISYEINAFTTRGSTLPRIMSDLHQNIVEVFNANGTQIMTPNYENDPAQAKIPSGPWDGALVLPEKPSTPDTQN